MKKLLLILSIVAFTNLSYGQVNSLKDAAAKSTKSITKTDSKEVQKQIQNGLTSNDELAAMGADYLKSNPDTRSAFAKLYKENKGSVNQAMKAVMNNPKLKSSVMDYINGNPEIMTKALGMLGM
tara:strand:+ start:35147 stop:35518 length:372 start_codon:yes stop_codon:yes gene_type:complete